MLFQEVMYCISIQPSDDLCNYAVINCNLLTARAYFPSTFPLFYQKLEKVNYNHWYQGDHE